MITKTQTSVLDTPVLNAFEGWSVGGRRVRITLETLIYVLLALIAVVAYFYNLGARTQSHDESLHALYSWKLYAGDGYEHNPMMHGPFLFHINALMYFLFGVSDYTTRISVAIFGVVLVLLPILLRKELGRLGALLVSALTLISPTTLYYARYIRNDVWMMVWAMLMAIALFRYLDSRQPKWIYLGAIAVTLAICTKENAYITGFIGFTFLVMLFSQQVLSRQGARRAYILGIAALAVLVVAMIGANAYMNLLPEAASSTEAQGVLSREQLSKVTEVLSLLVGVMVVMLLGTALIKREEQLRPSLISIAGYVIALLALVVICAAAGGAAWLAVSQLPEGLIAPTVFLLLQVIAVGAGLVLGGWAWWYLLRYAKDRGWLAEGSSEGEGFRPTALYVSAILVVVIFVLLHTTFFTNPKGLGTGTFGAITYWLAQQEVKRAGQPWYYYLVITPLYEFLPIGVGLAAMVYYFVTGKVELPTQGEAEDGVASRSSPVFVAYAVYWALSAWLIYSWAGEKMPWMMVHMAQPMIVLSGRFLNDVFSGLKWRKAWQSGGAVLALITPIILLSAGMVVGLPLFGQAFQGLSLNDLNDTSKWLAALVIGGGLVVIAVRIGRRLGKATAWRVVSIAGLVIGALFTIRYAWMAAYINYDTAKEFLVYAHASPDVKRTVKEIEEISLRLYGDEHSIRFAYSSDATWPFEWYFDRLFPNRVFFGREPTRETTDVPVLVVGRDEIAKTEPFLGNRYYRFDRTLVWWPHQDYYMGLSFAIPREENRKPGKNYFFLDMLDPEKRRQFWNVLFYRKYDQSLADWQPSHPFAFYVRKDIAAQLWDYGVVPSAVDLSELEDLYTKGEKELTPVAVWGHQGVGEGMFNSPRNIAVGPDDSLYVLDSGNNRVQKLAADGTYLTSWGHLCKMFEGQAGCESPGGAGGFNDPWGIAVDRDGFVYVADTWNHRVQKFTSDGEFVTMWGTYGVSEMASGAEKLFWGPRDIAIGPEGLVYVSDTGNKRVQVFGPGGDFVAQWGGKGILDGQFDEPVGIAVAADGTTFVADTWNQRIQVFDAQHFFLHKWEVDSWYGQSLLNKPYLALDARKRIYAADPEGYRVLVFDQAGQFLASLVQGGGSLGFQQPTGIAVDSAGYIYVVDSGAHQVVKFAPLE